MNTGVYPDTAAAAMASQHDYSPHDSGHCKNFMARLCPQTIKNKYDIQIQEPECPQINLSCQRVALCLQVQSREGKILQVYPESIIVTIKNLHAVTGQQFDSSNSS